MNNDLLSYVKKFQKGIIPRREFLKEVNSIILNIPTYLGHHDNDLRHEFYAHVISKIDKMIKYYKEYETASFITWFSIVLKREFFNFIKKYQKNQELETVQFSENIQQELITEQNDQANKNILPDLSFLTERERNVIALKFGLNTLTRDINDSIDQILDKIKTRETIEQKITKRYLKYIKSEKDIRKETEIDKIEQLKQEQIKILKSKRRLEKIFYHLSILPTNKWVGEKLGLSEGTIAAYLNKIKEKLLKRRIKEIA